MSFFSFYLFFITSFFIFFYPSRSVEITLFFIDILVNHALVTNVDVANMTFNAIHIYYRI